MEGPEIKAAEAVIDNGSFGKRTLRFETGRLAQQADGAVAAYLDDDTMILSTTTAGSSPKENYDFFPLTVDVEEKMYAAGKIPGSFFRRECRPSSEAILACGQYTLCFNLLEYIEKIEKDPSNLTEAHDLIKACKPQLLEAWEKFQANPQWMVPKK